MTANRTRIVFAQLAVMAFLALTANASLFAQNAFYAQTTAAQSTYTSASVPITGLMLTLPASSTAYNVAIVTLNLPNLYLSGTASGGPLGAEVSVWVGTSAYPKAAGQISSEALTSGTSGRKPATIVVEIPLTSTTQIVTGEWAGIRGSTIDTDTFGSLSAILVKVR